jgi:uncharacterized protein (DUF433 family)
MADVARLYGGKDPRELSNYGISEAASYLSIPRSTVRAWAKGMGRTFKPVIELPDPKGSALSFFNLVELHILDSIRRLGPGLPEIRKSVQYLRRELGVKRPLATEAFYVDGARILVEHLGQLVHPAKSQATIREVVARYLTRVEYAKDGFATRLYPFTRRGELSDPKSVVFDPMVSFGRLVLSGTGIPTEEIGDRFNAGETLEELARDFNVGREKIEEAIRCELHLKKAA